MAPESWDSSNHHYHIIITVVKSLPVARLVDAFLIVDDHYHLFSIEVDLAAFLESDRMSICFDPDECNIIIPTASVTELINLMQSTMTSLGLW